LRNIDGIKVNSFQQRLVLTDSGMTHNVSHLRSLELEFCLPGDADN